MRDHLRLGALCAGLALLAGCAAAPIPAPSAPSPSPAAPSETPLVTPAPAPLAYALVLNGTAWEVGQAFQAEGIFDEEERRDNPEEFPFPASRDYRSGTMTAKTFLEADGREKLVSLTTWGVGETPAGIAVGSTLEELKEAYPGRLVFRDGAFSSGYDGNGIAYTRMYACYDPEDGTNCSYQFYLNEKKVVMMEAMDELDSPRNWYGSEAPLGIENLHWEYLNDEAQTHMHYFVEHGDGAEETVLDIHGVTEHHDLDGDGELEILVYLGDGNTQGIGIYDWTENGIVYTDVNETLGCRWSSFMGLIANLGNPDYENCIRVGYGERTEVWSYADGRLTYECPFENAMGG